MGTYISPNGIGYTVKMPVLDLADEAMWEDIVECDDIDAVWTEDRQQPVFGLRANSGTLWEYVDWWCDGEENTNCHG